MHGLEVLSSTVGLRAHGLKKVLCCSLTLWCFVKIRLLTSVQTVLHVFFFFYEVTLWQCSFSTQQLHRLMTQFC